MNTRRWLKWPARTNVITMLIAAAGALGVFPAAAQQAPPSECGNPFVNHFGPFDYRSASAEHKKLVENIHFTPGVESLTKPATTTTLMMAGDVGYTLHVFPNHHRALLAMERLGERHKSDTPPGAKFSIDCYFRRAILFRPDDTVARGLYARYLGKRGRKDEALGQLAISTERAKDNPLSHFNIGLLYMELGEPALALEREHAARAMGLQRPELEQALRRAGQWRDPADAPAASAPAIKTP